MYHVGMTWWLATVIEMAQTASPARHAYSRAGDWQCKSTKGRVLCGTVYGEMHYKDLSGSIPRVGFRILVLDFYLALHDLRCRKSTLISPRAEGFIYFF